MACVERAAQHGGTVVPDMNDTRLHARWRSLYYGWVLVLTLSLTELTSWGILYYAFSVVAPAMQADLHWSKVAVTGAFSLALLVGGIAALPVGRWVDRHGPRWVMTAGSCAAVLLVVAWSQVRTLPALYAVWVGIGLVQATVLYEPAFALIAVWFRRQRGRALLVLTFFGGLASLVFIPLTARLVHGYGWRTALCILAGVLAGGTIAPHALLLRRRPDDLGLHPDGDVPLPAAPLAPPEASVALGPALRGATFWWLTLAFSLTTLGSVAFTVHLIPYLVEQGYDTAFAALVTGSFGAMSVAGRVLAMPLSTRVARHISTALLFVVQAAGFVALLLAPGRGGVWLAVALCGAGSGALTPARAGLLADYYGPTAYGRISGTLAFVTTWARAAAPVGASTVYMMAGYRPLWWALALLALLGSGAVLGAAHCGHPRPLHTAASRDLDQRHAPE